MKSIFKPVLIACLMAAAGFTALAQPMAPYMHEGMGHRGMGTMDPARMQGFLDKKNAAFKQNLKISPTQEAAWNTYVAAMKVPADMMAKRSEMADVAKLPTPERIDKMKALRAQHITEMNAVMDQRGEATKVFYAVLTPEQKKIFDDRSQHQWGAHGHMRDAEGHHGPAQNKP